MCSVNAIEDQWTAVVTPPQAQTYSAGRHT